MATFTFFSVADTWPSGTVVGVYARSGPQPEGQPVGAVLTTATVDASGGLAFAGLTENAPFWAGAPVAGVWRFRSFMTRLEGEGPMRVVRFANGVWPPRPETDLPVLWSGPSQPTTGMRVGDLFAIKP